MSKSPPRKNLNSSFQSKEGSLINLKNDKPEDLDITIFAKIGVEIENQFNISISSVEKNFRDNIHDIKTVFYAKLKEFQAYNDQLQENHNLISQQYEATQKKLKNKFDKIQAEKDAWEQEKRLIGQKNNFNSEVLNLNIGGTASVMCTQKVLCSAPNSQLEKMFSGMHEIKKVDDAIFLDRDGKTFQTLINYLRNDRKIYPEFENQNDQRLFVEELNFWGIKDDRLEESRLEKKFPQEIVDMLKIEPGEEIDFTEKNEVQDNVRQTWHMMGPLRLLDIVKNSVDKIDETLQYGKSIDKYKTQIYGQVDPNTGKVEGICRQVFAEPNSHIYEGQCKNEKRNGYGRQIYVDGNYYIGHWRDNNKHGWGKKVYTKTGKIEEGNWEKGEFKGQ